MAATGAKVGKGTRFLREDPVGSGTFVEVSEVKTINGPGRSRDPVEATHLLSDDDHAEYVPGIAEGGEVALTLNFRPDHVSQGAASGLAKDFDDGTMRKWRIEWPQFTNDPNVTFDGFLSGWEPPAAAPRDLLVSNIRIKVSGKPAYANFA